MAADPFVTGIVITAVKQVLDGVGKLATTPSSTSVSSVGISAALFRANGDGSQVARTSSSLLEQPGATVREIVVAAHNLATSLMLEGKNADAANLLAAFGHLKDQNHRHVLKHLPPVELVEFKVHFRWAQYHSSPQLRPANQAGLLPDPKQLLRWHHDVAAQNPAGLSEFIRARLLDSGRDLACSDFNPVPFSLAAREEAALVAAGKSTWDRVLELLDLAAQQEQTNAAHLIMGSWVCLSMFDVSGAIERLRRAEGVVDRMVHSAQQHMVPHVNLLRAAIEGRDLDADHLFQAQACSTLGKFYRPMAEADCRFFLTPEHYLLHRLNEAVRFGHERAYGRAA